MTANCSCRTQSSILSRSREHSSNMDDSNAVPCTLRVETLDGVLPMTADLICHIQIFVMLRSRKCTSEVQGERAVGAGFDECAFDKALSAGAIQTTNDHSRLDIHWELLASSLVKYTFSQRLRMLFHVSRTLLKTHHLQAPVAPFKCIWKGNFIHQMHLASVLRRSAHC